jgi:A/G-specific adenine glycosylase
MTLAGGQAARKHIASLPSPPAAALLDWYDRYRRDLPWRTAPGETPDPYRVWLSEIMLQQTTVKAVTPYFMRFTQRWPSVEALAATSLDDVLRAWAGLGYYARARNLHACARAVVARHDARFPASESELACLPGIGPYTAAAMAAIAFGTQAAALDGNAERVMARLLAFEPELPAARPALRELATALVPIGRPGDFAQALMDLGATICTPKRPACTLCPWMSNCAARRRGEAETFPRKAKKRAGQVRRGAAFVVLRSDQRVLVRSRPARGLLGGMTEVPTTAWTHDFDLSKASLSAPALAGATPRWCRVPGFVRHVFTHFPLELVVLRAEVSLGTRAPDGNRWTPLTALANEALPNVMRKVLAHAMGEARAQNRSRR